MKKSQRAMAAAAAMALMVASAGAASAESMPSKEKLWQMIQQQQQQINALKKQLESTDRRVEAAVSAPAATGGASWTDKITLGGAVEVEAGIGEDFAGNDASDITLATVELSLEARITDWVTANVVLLYEEDDTPLTVDEGVITIGNTDKYPVYMTAGMMGIPFGNFTTNMISDPLTQDMGELKESAIHLGFVHNGFYGGAYAFNGDANRVGKDDTLGQLGANLGYALATEDYSLDVGVSITNSLDDSNGIWDAINAAGAAANVTPLVNDHVTGVGAHMVVTYKGLMLVGEYVTATEDIRQVTGAAWNGEGSRPSAFNIEAGYTFNAAARDVTLAVAYQGTDEAIGLGLPEERIMASASAPIFNGGATLAAEYRHDEDYAINEGGTGNDTDSLTMQLGVEF